MSRHLKLVNVLVASVLLAGATAQPPHRVAGTVIEFRAAQ
jgi:hypothetical protein